MGKDRERMSVMSTIVSKWGNSLAIRIPSNLVESLNIKEGSEVELSIMDSTLTIKPKKRKPTLEELLAKITDGNHHEEIDFGKPEGNEVW
ncbi:AbrB/MazE/SpoVT family DNA-binding domain-containing protein [Paenibacillus larvae]